MLNHDDLYIATQPLPRPVGSYVRRPVTDFGAALIGILAAALIYAVVLGLFAFLMSILYVGANGQPFGELLCGVLSAAAIFLTITLACLVLGVAPLALLLLGLCFFAARSLSSKVNWPLVGGLAGGLTGYLGTIWQLGWTANDAGWLLSLLFGPILATLLGQAGGCWDAVAREMTRQRYSPEQDETPTARQFNIRQLLIATTWLAGILALLKLLGALGPGLAIVVLGGLVLQGMTLPLVILVARRYHQ
ncbi:hypothetical protein [Aeoliella sp.]|uniref:hypothetical protein n=1 Tax=Aeoliella sp. TaxID=2795800 RepID=UPI003CCC3673